jgi:amidase
MVPLAIGTQTTGSTTRPASFCGTFGYRPTWGDLRTNGVMEASGSLDTLGILARSVEDVALYRDVLLGVPHEPVGDVASPPRIGFCRTHAWPRLKAETRKLLEDVHRWISGFEMARNLTWEFENHWNEISETFRNGRVKDGLECSYEKYVEMRIHMHHCRKLLLPVFERHDVLLAASAEGEATLGRHPVPHPWVYMIWTTMHVPSITLPVFKGPHGLPIGAQLIARHHDERRLFDIARWVYRQLT